MTSYESSRDKSEVWKNKMHLVRRYLENGGDPQRLPEDLRPTTRFEMQVLDNLCKLVEEQRRPAPAMPAILPPVKPYKETWYLSPALSMLCFPHSSRPDLEYTRDSGDFTITLRGDPKFGLPYGAAPRFIMIHLCSEALRQQSRVVNLGVSPHKFIMSTGFKPVRGHRGCVRKFAHQLFALTRCTITVQQRKPVSQTALASRLTNRTFIEEADYWFDPDTLFTQSKVKTAYVKLDKQIYESLLNSTVPLNLQEIKLLRRNKLALDIYIWLRARQQGVDRRHRIPWTILQQQFGAEYSNEYEFRRKFKDALKTVLETCQGLDIYHLSKIRELVLRSES